MRLRTLNSQTNFASHPYESGDKTSVSRDRVRPNQSRHKALSSPDVQTIAMLPPKAQKKIQGWIRSRHVICSGSFFIFETVDYGTIERFSDCVSALGGTVIAVDSAGKVWMGNHRQVLLYRVRASLLTPGHELKQYWIKYGSFRTRFDVNP